jgi:hypothetical protein
MSFDYFWFSLSSLWVMCWVPWIGCADAIPETIIKTYEIGPPENPDFRNRSQVEKPDRRHKVTSEELVKPPGKNGQKQLTRTSFSITTPGTTWYCKTQEKMERSRTPWALKEQDLRPNPCLYPRRSRSNYILWYWERNQQYTGWRTVILLTKNTNKMLPQKYTNRRWYI